MRDEVDGYLAVLLGHTPPPFDNGVMTLLEYAGAVHARGVELSMYLSRAEADGVVSRGSKAYKFRTGELRSFIELASRAIDLGSRRLTAAKLDYDQAGGA